MKKSSFLFAAIVCAAPAFAQADECSGAVALAANTPTAFDTTTATVNAADPAWPCASGGAADIWYTFTTTQAGDVQVSTCNNATYDTAVEIFSGSCGSLTSLTCNDDGAGCAGFTSIATAQGVAANTQLFIRIGGFNGAQGTGTVELAEITTPTCSMDDAFEDNDDCAGSVAITDGTFSGLNVTDVDQDYFAVVVPAGNTLDVEIQFIDAFSDVDLYLWDPLVACDTNVVGQGTGTGALAVGFSASDNETVSYTNLTGAAQNLVIEVDMFTAGGCNDYNLVVTGAGVAGPGPIGANYCTAAANSTGSIGMMSGFGETSVAANDVTLTAASLPANQFGIFITSETQGFVPGAGGTSNGNLCLGGQINRFVGPGQILNSGATGEISLVLDLANFPNGGGITQVMAGESRSFQAWHRDAVGLGSNFTDGIQIDFTN